MTILVYHYTWRCFKGTVRQNNRKASFVEFIVDKVASIYPAILAEMETITGPFSAKIGITTQKHIGTAAWIKQNGLKS